MSAGRGATGRELKGQGRRVALLAPMSLLGAASGALLLLVLPEEAFSAIVPVLLAISLVLVITQPGSRPRWPAVVRPAVSTPTTPARGARR